jgi:hypothetical protein
VRPPSRQTRLTPLLLNPTMPATTSQTAAVTTAAVAAVAAGVLGTPIPVPSSRSPRIQPPPSPSIHRD